MDMIVLKNGKTFFGDVIDYDWKGKFLVVETKIDDVAYKEVIHWDNVARVVKNRVEQE